MIRPVALFIGLRYTRARRRNRFIYLGGIDSRDHDWGLGVNHGFVRYERLRT